MTSPSNRTYFALGRPVEPFAYAAPPGTFSRPGATCNGCRHLRIDRKPTRAFHCQKAAQIQERFAGFIDPRAPACLHFQRRRAA